MTDPVSDPQSTSARQVGPVPKGQIRLEGHFCGVSWIPFSGEIKKATMGRPFRALHM